MARCGCNPECHCTITNGDCTTVSGAGSPADPYIVSVVVDNDTIFCTPDGLQAVLNTQDTNTVDLEGNGTAADPLTAEVILTPDANVPDPDAVGFGNLLKEITPEGIYVSCEDIQDCVGAAISQIAVSDCLEYVDATNTINVLICAEPNGIECAPAADPDCPAGGLLVTPSADPANGLVFGTDGRLFFESPAIQAGDCIVITGTGTPADPFVITPQVAPELNGLECVPGQGLLVFPSADANNGLTFGTDNRLWVDRCPFIVGAAQTLIGNNGPCFELTGDGCNTPLSAIFRISDDPCNGLECRGDGFFVEVDPTPAPDPVSNTANTPGFPGLGPFNGTGGPNVVDGPTCINIVNPSACRNLITTINLVGFTDVGRQNGEMSARFEVSDNAGGPFQQVHINTQSEPTPPSRLTLNASFQGREIVIPPGGNRTACVRTLVAFNAVQTGRLFFSERTLSIVGRWAV